MLRRPASDYQPPDLDGYYEDEEPPPRRRPGGRTLTVVLYVIGLAFLTVAVLRILGIDGDLVTIEALTLTPYIAAAGGLLFLIAFLLRRRILAVAVLLMSVSMGVLLLPRVQANDQPAAQGPHVAVLTVPGGVPDPETLVKLVRDNNIDVLTLPGLSQTDLARLDAAGIGDVLPNRAVAARPASNGAAIMSRFPVRQTILIETIALPMPSAVVDLPGRDDIEIVAVQVRSAPQSSADTWRRELGRLPPAQKDRVRVLAGDFSATFDHAAFRAVLDRGYVDAAEQTGNGMIPTWQGIGPPLTVDHVVVEGSDPYSLRFADAGGFCERTFTPAGNFAGFNFRVTLTTGEADIVEQRQAVRILQKSHLPGRWAVKDSFRTLDIARLGFEVLLEANWIRKAHPKAGAMVSGLAWERVRQGGDDYQMDVRNATTGEAAAGALVVDPTYTYFANVPDPVVLKLALRRSPASRGGRKNLAVVFSSWLSH